MDERNGAPETKHDIYPVYDLHARCLKNITACPSRRILAVDGIHEVAAVRAACSDAPSRIVGHNLQYSCASKNSKYFADFETGLRFDLDNPQYLLRSHVLPTQEIRVSNEAY